MLTEVAAPNEIYESEPPSKPGRVGTILSRARSSVSLRGAAATATSHPAAVATPSGHDRPRVFSHSPSIAYTRRHSQQSLRSGPDMPHILSKLVVNARAPHTGRSPETRPVAAQSPAPSFEDSKCSSMQTSESGHSFSKTDPVSAALQPQLAAHSLPAGNSVTSTGVTNDGASIPPARAFETFRMDQDPIPTSHLARRTTSRGHVQAPSQMAAARAGVQGRELASTAESTWKPSVGAGQRDPPAKSASVGGQMGTRRVGRASSPPTERIASDQGVVLTPSSVSIDEIHDNGERIAFEVPGRRGKLHVSLAWLPGRARAVQTQSASGPMPPTHGRTAAGRRVSLQVPPNAQQAPSHRRSLSASEAPSHVRPFCPPPHLVHASVPHGAPPTSVPAGHFMPGTAPLQVPGYGLHVGDHVPQSVPGVHPAMGSQMSTAVPLPVMPMQARLGIPLAPWPVHAGHVPHMQAAPLGRPAPASQRPGIGLGLAPGFEQTPSRAVTFPAPSTISPWRRLWPFGKNTHNDPFLICPAVSSKASRFAEPIVMEHMSQKEIDRKRRAQRRDECAKRKSGSAAKVRGESGNNAK
ncbi:hypothetical protein CspeluHIS016_0110680 [Cutaneotrichosporon spelunceum]|uniref:Uncharacterized protein n=1 Tax=Cutaneotrichosporon spelunceum TaxID=1672016 RepID=A0AAD3TPM1_9TREE|nr:hypothetical protein CspeluHIS016_0110680 [Cutaneotrichosporon spelunceum]